MSTRSTSLFVVIQLRIVNRLICIYRSAQEKSSGFAFRRGTPLERKNTSRKKVKEKKKKTFFSPRVFFAKFRGETLREIAMGKYGPKVSSCGQRSLSPDRETAQIPRLICVYTGRTCFCWFCSKTCR